MKNLFLLILMIISVNVFSQEDKDGNLKLKIKGFADTYHAFRCEKPNDWMSSRSRLRTEFSLSHSNTEVFFSSNAVYNSLISSYSGFKIRELYICQSFSNFELRVGRQIITWGVADALRLTDIISPMDYSEFLAQDYDDIRIPETAIRLKFSKNAFSFDILAIPVIETFELPFQKDNPWAISLTANDSIIKAKKPDFKIENSEFGGRFSWFLSGMDFSVCALRTFNKMPVFALNFDPIKQQLIGKEHFSRMTMIGSDISIPVSKFVIRGELAIYFNEAQQPNLNAAIYNKNSINTLLGVDIYPGDDWNLSFQYSHKRINGINNMINAYRNSGTATVRVSKELFRNTLNINTFAYIDVTSGGIYDRTSFDYALNDIVHISLGFDYFKADQGIFKLYDKNSEIWIKIKASF